MKKNIFKEIFSKYDTDKTQSYSEAYDLLFTPIRNDIYLVFEIGVNRGGSIKAWKEFFPNALIVGIDINQKCFFKSNKIKIEIGNAADKEFIDILIKKYGKPDIVIDDGSHFSSEIKAALKLLVNKAKKYYVIEDIGTQTVLYKDGFYIDDGVPATEKVSHWIYSLMLHNLFFKSIHIYHSIVFLEQKTSNE